MNEILFQAERRLNEFRPKLLSRYCSIETINEAYRLKKQLEKAEKERGKYERSI